MARMSGQYTCSTNSLGAGDHVADVGQPLGVDRRGVVQVDGARHPAHQEVRVRVLAAEDRVQPDDVALPVERLEVVRHGEQVHLGRKLVGRMAPVAVGEDPELAAGDELLDPVLHPAEVGLGVVGPGRDLARDRRGAGRVGLESRSPRPPSRARAGDRSGSRGPACTACRGSGCGSGSRWAGW